MNLNARKPGAVLCLWADLVLLSSPQAGLAVKFSREFRSVSESKNQPQQTPGNPSKKYKDGLLPFKALNVFHMQFSTH